MSQPLYLLYVGSVSTHKGAGRVVQIARELLNQRLSLELHVVGDGPERPSMETWVREQGLSPWITFHGWFPKTELFTFYGRAHFLLLPSVSEGWPNVISEALAHGVVPLAGAVSVIPQMLREIRAGKAMDPMDTMAYIQAILGYVSDPPRWKRESLAGLAEAYRFTHSLYLKALRGAFSKAWG